MTSIEKYVYDAEVVTNTATFIKQLREDFKGDARLYRVSPAVEWYKYGEEKNLSDYVVVSSLFAAFDTGSPETYIFPANESGQVIDWGELEGSFDGDVDHERALTGAGYEVVE